jgi:hypothetical protein
MTEKEYLRDVEWHTIPPVYQKEYLVKIKNWKTNQEYISSDTYLIHYDMWLHFKKEEEVIAWSEIPIEEDVDIDKEV